MKIDRHGFRPCNACLRIRAGIRDRLGQYLPGFSKPAFRDVLVRENSIGLEIMRVRADTGAVVEVHPETPETRAYLRKHIDINGARLRDRVSREPLPFVADGYRIVDRNDNVLNEVQ